MYCGLDFGTSNSTLGATDASGAPMLLPVEGDRSTIPSAVFFDFEQDRTLFGRAAIGQYLEGADGRLMQITRLPSAAIPPGTYDFKVVLFVGTNKVERTTSVVLID